MLFNKALKKNPKMQLLEIAEDNAEAREYVTYSLKEEERHYWKLLPHDIRLTANSATVNGPDLSS